MKATLSFIPDLPIFQHEKPYELWLPAEEIPESLPWTNCQFFEHLATEIKVARSSNTDFGYETTRFKHLSSPLSQCFTGDSNWRYNNSMAQKYIKETVKLIERVLCTEGPVLRLETGIPHAAFYNPDSIFGDNPRESIEIRLLVLTKNIMEET
ncbi:hypothetical protein AOQ84DRAFT_377157 [Glonium stellatum]|uniref:Uncharacterized protein n=1 Tax=Glonium stellatum TaxID=574774 RepID=A0A8E2F065_9PEZI|nr:hypothetical protein AOQ84DRAFT_377157 [Glonium stellatum]